MRAVIQRVNCASVLVEGQSHSSIGKGLLVFLGIGKEDTEADVKWMVEKVANLRIFNDKDGKMNFSILEEKKELLLVSQFTLYGDCRKGRRADYSQAAPPEGARVLYELCVEAFRNSGLVVKTGVFQAHMHVTLENDGPVTFLLDSRIKK